MDKIGALAGRWRSEWNSRGTLARLGSEFHKVLRLVEVVPAKRVELNEAGLLSRKGIDEAAREHFAANVIPDLRRAAHEVELTVNDLAGRRARLSQVEYDKTDARGAALRQEMRALLRSMSEGDRAARIMAEQPFRAAAFEGPALLSGLTEEARTELRRRIVREEQPAQSAQLDEGEQAVEVANAAINLVVGELQKAAGFEHDELGFESWMEASSAKVEHEIAAGQRRTDGRPQEVDYEQVRKHVGQEIDRIFEEGCANYFKALASRKASSGNALVTQEGCLK